MSKVNGWWVGEHALRFDGVLYVTGDPLECEIEMATHLGDSFAIEDPAPPKKIIPKASPKAGAKSGTKGK